MEKNFNFKDIINAVERYWQEKLGIKYLVVFKKNLKMQFLNYQRKRIMKKLKIKQDNKK